MINPLKIFEVYEGKGKICTKNLIPGEKVYTERLYRDGGIEYREWIPEHSKLSAAIHKGASSIGIRKDSVVLYLGASTGTTVSHVSDIAIEGFIFALDFAPRVLRELVFLSEKRPNIAPIMADASQPDTYKDRVSQADIIYQDIAQRDQETIFLKNIDAFLKPNGFAILCLKARSIDVTKKPSVIFKEIKDRLEKQLTLVDYRTLEPFEMDHAFFIFKKK
jgi:fibrillarin-like pre-rRNA processing protein